MRERADWHPEPLYPPQPTQSGAKQVSEPAALQVTKIYSNHDPLVVLFTVLSLHQLSYRGAFCSDKRNANMAMNGLSRPAPGES
jgi:hypothetical protein